MTTQPPPTRRRPRGTPGPGTTTATPSSGPTSRFSPVGDVYSHETPTIGFQRRDPAP